MAIEYREYRHKREARKERTPHTHKFFRKLLRQTLLSLIIFIAVLGLKATTSNNPGKISIFFRTAMTEPVNTESIKYFFNSFIRNQ